MPNGVGIPPTFTAQRAAVARRGQTEGPGWLGSAIEKGVSGIWAGLNTPLLNVADAFMSGASQIIDSLQLPSEPVSSADFQKLVQERWRKAMAGEGMDNPFAVLFLLLSNMISFATLPLTMRGVLDQKFVIQPLNQTVRPGLIDPQSLLTAWLRDFAQAKNPDEILSKLGYPDDQIAILKEVAHYVPAAQDIIAFAVREAYDDEYAKEFDQDQGFEKLLGVAGADIKAAGLRPEIFKRFWRAHWQLPGLVQAYEMLHRDVIDSGDLDQLFIAADVMPWWRDKLKAISYRPLTRVDVRRIAKLLKKEPAWIKRQYQNLGYDDTNSDTMTEFTVEYNATVGADTITERDLTKGDLFALFKGGAIKEAKFRTMLAALNYDVDEVDYLVDRADMERERDRTNDIIKLTQKQYTKGQITLGQASGRLVALNLTDTQSNFLLQKWTIEKQLGAPTPSRADLGRFLSKEIISRGEYVVAMRNKAYDDQHIQWYMAEAQEVPIEDVRKWWEKGIES